METVDYRPMEIDGKKYVPIDLILTGDSGKKKEELLEKVGGFVQQIKNIKLGWLGGGYGVVVCLIPEDKVLEFCQADV